MRELAAELGVSTATVHHHLGRLRNEGLVEWQPNLRRTLRAR